MAGPHRTRGVGPSPSQVVEGHLPQGAAGEAAGAAGEVALLEGKAMELILEGLGAAGHPAALEGAARRSEILAGRDVVLEGEAMTLMILMVLEGAAMILE